MKIKKYILLLAAAASISASAQTINPITKAMLDTYDEMLKQNPNDYLTLYERAAQYYRLSAYDTALNDIKRAISLTPAKEKQQLSSEYSLCADIYTQLGEYSQALEAINNALACTPASYPLLYMKGNTCLYLNDIQGAKQAFQAMTRVQSRSQEALFGLAKVAILENNLGLADNYIKDAEELAPASYVTYCRSGDLHKEMGKTQQAAADYISAFCLNTSNERPMSSMITLANVDYPAVINSIDYALTQTSNSVPLYFLKGTIAMNSGHYNEAYEAYRHLIDGNSEGADKLSAAMANICLNMGNLEEADSYSTRALRNAKNADSYLTKARVEEANGNYASALIYAKNAAQAAPSSSEAALEVASLQIATGDYDAAYATLTNALLNNPTDINALLIRGYLQKNSLGTTNASTTDLQRASSLAPSNDYEIVLKAVAQELAGKKLDADATIAPILAKADNDAESAYFAAIYMKNSGDAAKTKEYKEKARKLGYENKYRLNYSVMPVISLKSK